jgi:sugar phosphate permease
LTGRRGGALGAALVFIVILAALTFYVTVTSGVSVLTIVSLVVLGMFAFGIVGALIAPPPDEDD